MKSTFAILVAACSMLLQVSFADQCPTINVQPNFNLTEYVARPWFIQQQMNIQYLPAKQNYCVRAIYTLKDATSAADVIRDALVDVFNYANNDKINGQVSSAHLCAKLANTSEPAKLSVGPCFLPEAFYGPYWVAAAGPSPDNYEWALVIGGQPTISGPNGCRTGDGVNNAGLWVFSRTQVAPKDQVEAVRKIASGKGLDLTVLQPVAQQGCLYQPKTSLRGSI